MQQHVVMTYTGYNNMIIVSVYRSIDCYATLIILPIFPLILQLTADAHAPGQLALKTSLVSCLDNCSVIQMHDPPS